MYASGTIHHHLCVAAVYIEQWDDVYVMRTFLSKLSDVYIEQWDDVYVMRTFLSKASEIHKRKNQRFSDYKCTHQAPFTTIIV